MASIVSAPAYGARGREPSWRESSGRAPSPDALTATEQRVAALVAVGRTNPEVAAELFLTVNTVEKTLTRIYTKLGVRSRTELARKLAVKE